MLLKIYLITAICSFIVILLSASICIKQATAHGFKLVKKQQPPVVTLGNFIYLVIFSGIPLVAPICALWFLGVSLNWKSNERFWERVLADSFEFAPSEN